MKRAASLSPVTLFGTRMLVASITLLAALTVMSASASAQVSVTATAGTLGPTPYTTVKLAFDAINAGTHQGAITIDIQANTTEGTTPATLNSSGAGSAVYTSVLIRPTTDGVSISGNPVTGFGVIQLNGADNVTIDGDNPNTGGINRNLTVSNTTTATVIANSAIRLATSAAVTSADNNTIKNCVLLGNVTAGNAAAITSAAGSSNSSFGIYAGGNGGATAIGAPTAITSVTTNTAPSGTTINNLTIDNNSVNQCARAIVFNGAATSVSTGVTITNNVVGDQGAPTPATPPYTTPATTVYTKGIWVAGTGSITVTGNTLKNIMSYVATTITTVELVSPIGTTATISNNTITNPTNNNSAGSPVKAILVSNATGTLSISGNIISNVQSVAGASGTAGIDESGAGVTSATIELNKITTVRNRSTGTFGCWGLSVGAGNNVVVRNNFVSDLNMDMTGGGAFSTTFGVHGIRIATGTGHKVYHNSVNMFGALSGTATTNILTSAFTIVSTASTGMDVRNNIFSNTMTGGTTSIAHVSIYLPSGGTSAMNLTLNNNGYYFGSDAARQGVGQAGATAGTNFFTTLAALMAYSSTLSAGGTNDNSSFATTSAAPFTSATDLHIPNSTVTQLESGGASGTGVTVDIDAEARNVSTPDIGADEFSGVAVDLTPPSISYTTLANTSSTSNRTLSNVVITDASGVNTTPGTKPRVYYKKSTDTNDLAATGWKFVEANGSSSPFDFTINYSLLNAGSVSANDVIQYFVVAQDLASTPNVGINSGTFAATPASVALTGAAFPIGGTINSYRIAVAFSGSINVGAAQTYTSLTLAGGVFETLNNNVISGNLTINITSDLTGEDGTIALNQLSEEGVGNYTVTIKPSGAARSITGSSTVGIIRLNDADRVTIDGSLTGGTATGIGGDPTLRNLTVQNTNTAATAGGVIIVMQGTNGAQNDAIKNVNVQGQDPAQTLLGIGIGGNTVGTSPTVNNNNTRVENCSVQKAILGIFYNGVSAASPNTGAVITRNDLSATGANRLKRGGIFFFFQNGIQVTENSIGGISTDESADGIGIMAGIQNITTTNVTAGGVTNALISRNLINGVAATSTVGFSAAGIAIAGDTGGANTVVNNMILGVNAPSTSPDIVAGIFVAGVVGSSTKLYHNSISLTGDRTAVASQIGSYGVAISGSNPTVELKNNIFYTTQTSGGGATAKSYAIGTASTTFTNMDSNFNDFFASGANAGGFRTASLDTTGTDLATLAAWQGATSKDANSLSVDPLFVSPTTDLHLQSGSPVLAMGTLLASVNNDFDNDLRDDVPDIGADELVAGRTGSIPAGTYHDANIGTGTLAGNVTITNQLTLSGKLDTGANTLTIDCNGFVSGAGATNYVIGNLARNYCGTGGKAFDVGTANGYSPANVNATAGTFPATFTIKAVQGAQPSVNPATSIQRYWTLTNAGLTSANLTFQYLAGDVLGNESNYKLIRVSGGTPVGFPASVVTPATHVGTLAGVTGFSDWTVGEITAPTAANGSISGVINTPDGHPIGGVSVNLSGGQSARTITNSQGQYRFSNLESGGFYTVTPGLANYSFSPSNRSFSLGGNRTDAGFTASADGTQTENPLNFGDFFVRQQYLDFLGREPDQQGWLFWTEQLNQCGIDANCIRQKRIDISAAFFQSDEFQLGGNYVYRMYRAALGRRLTYAEFSEDRQQVVGGPGLDASRIAFADSFVTRPEFVQKYQNINSDEVFVDALLLTVQQDAGLDLTSQREALIQTYNAGADTNHSRSAVLRAVAESTAFKGAVYNASFVLTEYFGYLQRGPDTNGYNFWVEVLNHRDPGNYRGMVCSFLTSTEYQQRFSSVVVHGNNECGR